MLHRRNIHSGIYNFILVHTHRHTFRLSNQIHIIFGLLTLVNCEGIRLKCCTSQIKLGAVPKKFPKINQTVTKPILTYIFACYVGVPSLDFFFADTACFRSAPSQHRRVQTLLVGAFEEIRILSLRTLPFYLDAVLHLGQNTWRLFLWQINGNRWFRDIYLNKYLYYIYICLWQIYGNICIYFNIYIYSYLYTWEGV